MTQIGELAICRWLSKLWECMRPAKCEEIEIRRGPSTEFPAIPTLREVGL